MYRKHSKKKKKRLQRPKTVYHRGETGDVYYVEQKKKIIGYVAIELIKQLILKIKWKVPTYIIQEYKNYNLSSIKTG